MARKHPNRRLPGWLSLRRRAALVPVAVALVGLLVAVTAAGWAGWLVDHPGQAWQWVVRHWFVPPALLARWPLPAVEEVDPYEVGVFYSRRADAYRGQQPRPPYVPRAVDHELAALLDSQPLVLLKGQSRAGKSVPRRFL